MNLRRYKARFRLNTDILEETNIFWEDMSLRIRTAGGSHTMGGKI
jgi:hypothetical protein